MGKLTRKLDTPEAKEYWKFADEMAEKVRKMPAWKRGGASSDNEISYQPYKHKPTVMEKWLGSDNNLDDEKDLDNDKIT